LGYIKTTLLYLLFDTEEIITHTCLIPAIKILVVGQDVGIIDSMDHGEDEADEIPTVEVVSIEAAAVAVEGMVIEMAIEVVEEMVIEVVEDEVGCVTHFIVY
jgi:hypothetical protein